MTEAPLSWVRTIRDTLIDAKIIPLSGELPPFPWEEFSSQLGALLQIPELKISLQRVAFLRGTDIATGFGIGFVPLVLDLTPLRGQAYWLMGKEDVSQLTAFALTSQAGKAFSSPKFQEGFYYYLFTHFVEIANDLKVLDDLKIKMAKPGTLTQEESLCVDVQIQLPKQTLWGRLVCPASLHQEIRSHFSTRQPLSFAGSFARQLDVSLAVELGQTQLSLSRWKEVKTGDFIILDRCSYDPASHKGSALLTLEQTPIFRAKIKDTSLKIVDYAIYREEQSPMEPEIPEENEEESFAPEEPTETEDAPSDVGGHWESEAKELVSNQEIPLTLTVEVAKLRIPLQKLLELSVGNVLELPVKPEHGVDVLIGGKKVAKAELVKLGDMLGVKILKLGE